jgi:hypothetical protein
MGNCFGIACQPAIVSPANIGQRKHPLESVNMPDFGQPTARRRTKYGQRGMDFVRGKWFETEGLNPYVS